MKVYINLTPFKDIRGNIFVGNAQGEYAREVLRIDILDKKLKRDGDFELEVQFPDDTVSVTSGFLEGLLGPTFKNVGYDAFYARIKFYSKEYKITKDVLDFIDLMKLTRK